MPLVKQPININFSQGLDTKSDPNQVPVGRFTSLKNTVLNKTGLLSKRNGFAQLTSLPSTSGATTVSTYNGRLVSVGNNIYAYNSDSQAWNSISSFTQADLSVVPVVRTSYSLSVNDSAVNNGLICTTFLDGDGYYKYTVSDLSTGSIVVPVTSLNTSAKLSRVFALGNYFVITYLITVSSTPHIKYISIPVNNPSNAGSETDLSSQVSSNSAAYDGYVANNNLFLAWDGSDSGHAVRITSLNSTLTQGGTVTIASRQSTLLSVTADTTQSTPTVWVTSYLSSGSISSAAFDQNLNSVLSLTSVVASPGTTVEMTSSASNQSLTIIYELSATYSYNSTRSDTLKSVSISQGGTAGSVSTIARGLGIASKLGIVGTVAYFLAAYQGTYQPTYFLLNSSGTVVGKLAYSNGNGYASTQILPSPALTSDSFSVSYLYRDQIESVNKTQGSSTPSGVYAQVGINQATFNLAQSQITTVEIGGSLHIPGAQLMQFDGTNFVEHGFHLFPEDFNATWSATGGSIVAQPDGATNTNAYYYQVVYEWTDAAGNIHRSAPSIPLVVTTTGTGTSGTITLNIPTLRVTSKPNVRITIYRWSVGQQAYYKITSITSPLLNDKTVDSVSYSDTQADSSILGNALIYTTGNVVENVAPPACTLATLFKSRMFLVDAEDPNTLWYSKQVIESTPVEMSDLFTQYIAPTTGAQGSTGPTTAISVLDDKLILFKKDAIYYVTGDGPDNTGSNDDFSEPVFITATVGCSNQQSIVFIPQGLLFQSDKGIWLLGRDLNTSYIGAPVEAYNSSTVTASLTVPGTNEVRFTLDTGETLVFNYFYEQWGTFSGIPGISSTLFQSKHTFLNKYGQIYQENPGSYLDGSNPVLISFTTSWVNLAGLQGYQRAYFFYLLGTYQSPHKLNIQIAYDYDSNPQQSTVLTPDNYSPAYGGNNLYGGSSVYGGSSAVEQWRVFFTRQKCESFQLSVNEVYDPSYGVAAGAGLTLSGLNLVIGAKSGYPRISSGRSVA